MLKLFVVAVLIACASSAVMPKPPATHDVKHETPAVKSTPLHPEHHSSTENHKLAEVKADGKKDDKAKSVSHHEVKSDDKEKNHHHQQEPKKVEHNPVHHATSKHYDVPVNVGHGDKTAHEAHKSEKVENVKAKPSEHGH